MTFRELNKVLAPAFRELRIWDAGINGGKGSQMLDTVRKDCQVIKDDHQSIYISRYSASHCDELMSEEIHMICPDDGKPDECLVLMYE